MSYYTDFINTLSRFMSANEINNLREAILTGARSVAQGKYGEEAVRNAAKKICSLIEKAHPVEIKLLERDLGRSFQDYCVDMIVTSVYEQSIRLYRLGSLVPEAETSKSERSSRLF